MTHAWHLVTGEYPPQPGGVSDYTRAVAEALGGAGAEVHVWAPPLPAGVVDAPDCVARVHVHRLPDVFGDAALAMLTRGLNASRGPRTVLIQYVPHAFGRRGMNLRFCRWVQHRARMSGDDVRVMFHEPYFPFGPWPLRHNVLAFATRIMAVLLMSDIRLAYVSTRAWRGRLAHYAPRALRFEWLPIPAAVGPAADPPAIAGWRTRLTAGGCTHVVGHFGTFGRLVTRLLDPTLEALLAARADVRVCLIGAGSEEFAAQFVARHPGWTGRVAVTGSLPAAEVAACIQACDVMLQPYADGASGRRTTLMAALINGAATVSTRGPATEPEWSQTEAVLLSGPKPAALARAVETLLTDDGRRHAVGTAGRALYERCFALRHTVERLLAGEGA